MFKPFTHKTATRFSTSPARTLSKLWYYARSIPRLLLGIQHPWRTVALFLGLEPFPAEIELRPSGLRLQVADKMDVWVAKETCLDDCYFPRWVRAEADWRVIDIGGGVGDFALMVAERCPDGVVHVYEPSPESFTFLQANVHSNRAGNVVAYRSAVADEACEMTGENGEQHRVAAGFHKSGTGALKVGAVSLDSALDALPDGECDFMKIDCEGGEFDILLESDPALLGRVHRISLEFHDGFTQFTGADIAAHLEAHGFRVWERPSPVHSHQGQLYAERIGSVTNDLTRPPGPG